MTREDGRDKNVGDLNEAASGIQKFHDGIFVEIFVPTRDSLPGFRPSSRYVFGIKIGI